MPDLMPGEPVNLGIDRADPFLDPGKEKEMSLPSTLTVSELQASGAPGMSSIRRWYESARGGSSAMARAKLHAEAAANGLRSGGESLIVGGLLGALHVEKGLDYKKVPVDAVVGGLGLVAGAALAHEQYGKDLANAGSAALAIFSFRKTYEFLAEKKKADGKPVAGGFKGASVAGDDYGAEDPIIAAAKFL